MATKTPHASLSWTGYYDNECFTHRSSKEASGHWPSNPNCGRTGYDITIPEIKTKTLAIASRSHSKKVRKTTEQLDEMLRVQQLEPAEITYRLTPSVDDTSSEEEPEQDDIPERITHKQINQHSDEQFIELYSIPNTGPRTHYTPKLRIEDHPYLRVTDPNH
ncbi:hypothetical protein CcaCcLH18_07810 [Colletotrichum camelliae]|nr:hypothetical protein CcaCcLH18_07810 [Colletotrichum camelliae]